MRLRTVGIVVALALGLLVAPLTAARAQPRGKKLPQIGFLAPGAFAAHAPQREAFLHGLHQLGWIEGQNVTMVYRYAEGKPEHLLDLATELVRLKVDVLFASSTPAIQAAQRATSTIPIIMLTLTDPVAAGFVASLARPGGNTSGISGLAPELSGKRLELLKEAVPGITRLAVLANPANPDTPFGIQDVERAAQALGVQLQVLEVRNPGELDQAFATILGERANALTTLPDPMLFAQRTRIVEFAATHRLPAVYPDWQEWVEAGGLMFYGSNRPELYRRAAHYVDRVLKGVKPATLPVEQPLKFELVLNLKTAEALGIMFPPTLLVLADRVIR